MFANSSSNIGKEHTKRQETRHSGMLSSFKSTCDAYLDKNGHDAVAKLVPKMLSSIPPRMNTWRRNSTPKPFALSIFNNWNVGFSPIHDSLDNSTYHSVQASVQLSKTMSHDSAFKSSQSVEKSGCSPSCDHQYESATEASSDFSIELMRKKRMYVEDEDERETKRFRFSNLHGKPVKNLVEIFTAVEDGDITV